MVSRNTLCIWKGIWYPSLASLSIWYGQQPLPQSPFCPNAELPKALVSHRIAISYSSPHPSSPHCHLLRRLILFISPSLLYPPHLPIPPHRIAISSDASILLISTNPSPASPKLFASSLAAVASPSAMITAAFFSCSAWRE